jgi:hypothetical protein
MRTRRYDLASPNPDKSHHGSHSVPMPSSMSGSVLAGCIFEQRWTPRVGQFGGRDKLGSGFSLGRQFLHPWCPLPQAAFFGTPSCHPPLAARCSLRQGGGGWVIPVTINEIEPWPPVTDVIIHKIRTQRGRTLAPLWRSRNRRIRARSCKVRRKQPPSRRGRSTFISSLTWSMMTSRPASSSS